MGGGKQRDNTPWIWERGRRECNVMLMKRNVFRSFFKFHKIKHKGGRKHRPTERGAPEVKKILSNHLPKMDA